MRDIQCDIAVIGTDYVGLCCGFALRKLGLKVEFISIEQVPSAWLAPWVHLHGRPGGLDWTDILPKASPDQSIAPLQLGYDPFRITLEPTERPFLSQWLETSGSHEQTPPDPKLLKYFDRKSPSPPSRQRPALAAPAASGLVRYLRSQRGGALHWPRGDRERTALDLTRFPGKALFTLSGLCEASEMPSFLEDDVDSFLFGSTQTLSATALLEAIEHESKGFMSCERLDNLHIHSSFGAIKSIEVSKTTKLQADTYLFNLPMPSYKSLTGDPTVKDRAGASSTFWKLHLKKLEQHYQSSGRVLHMDTDESTACYLSWTSSNHEFELDLVTTEDVAYEDVALFIQRFFKVGQVSSHQETKRILPTLSQLEELRISTRYRNGLYVGEALAPLHHLGAQCDVAEQLLEAVSTYREAPLNLSTLPKLK